MAVAARWAAWERAGRVVNAFAPAKDPITFPATPLKVLAELALGADLTQPPSAWPWTDATSIFYTRDPIKIQRGRADESAVSDASRLSATVNNRGGHWSTRNPMSPWYGLLRKGTPIRISAEGHVRYTGFISELPPRWDVSGVDQYAPIAALGLLDRLAQGSTPARSALYRSIADTDPIAYWTLEDGTTALVPAAWNDTGTARVVSRPAYQPGVTSGPTGTTSLYGIVPLSSAATYDRDRFTKAGVVLEVPDHTATGVEIVTMHVRWLPFEAPNAQTNTSLVQLDHRIEFVGGDVGSVRIMLESVKDFSAANSAYGNVIVNYYDASRAETLPGGGLLSPNDTDVIDGQWHEIQVRTVQNGPDVDVEMWIDGELDLFASDTIPGATLGISKRIVLASTCKYSDSAVNFVFEGDYEASHISVHTDNTVGQFYGATIGYVGEQAHTRFLRLCDEEDLVATCLASTSQTMGPQGTKSVLELLRDLEAADAGYLYEGLDFGLVYQSHSERENVPPTFDLDYASDGHVFPPLEPTDDTQKARNDVEIKRQDGSSSHLTEDSTSVELSIPNIGRRDESLTLNLETDDQTLPMAGLRLHLGTWPGYRYPTVAMNFNAAPQLIDGFCNADLAFRTTIDNPPDDIGPDQIDLIVEGYTETLEQFAWPIEANCSPYGPWHIFRTSETTGDTDVNVGYLVPTSCVLAEDLDTTETAVDITTTPLWSTSANDWTPGALIVVDGETMLVTAVSGGSNPQTLTVTRSVNGVMKTHSSGALVDFVSPGVLAL